MTNASLVFEPITDPFTGKTIVPNSSGCTLCPYMLFQNPDPTSPTKTALGQVVLVQSRGRFDGGVTKSSGKYHAGYVNDSWALGKRITVNLGLRWEQQRLVGNQTNKVFNDMWSPRIGFVLDPKGDRKTSLRQLWTICLRLRSPLGSRTKPIRGDHMSLNTLLV